MPFRYFLNEKHVAQETWFVGENATLSLVQKVLKKFRNSKHSYELRIVFCFETPYQLNNHYRNDMNFYYTGFIQKTVIFLN